MFKLNKCGYRAFLVAGPRIWNELPRGIRHRPSVTSFKQALKTHDYRDNSSLYLLFPGLPGAHRAYGCLRLIRPHYYYYYYYEWKETMRARKKRGYKNIGIEI